jgi:hypothetical protein
MAREPLKKGGPSSDSESESERPLPDIAKSDSEHWQEPRAFQPRRRVTDLKKLMIIGRRTRHCLFPAGWEPRDRGSVTFQTEVNSELGSGWPGPEGNLVPASGPCQRPLPVPEFKFRVLSLGTLGPPVGCY